MFRRTGNLDEINTKRKQQTRTTIKNGANVCLLLFIHIGNMRKCNSRVYVVYNDKSIIQFTTTKAYVVYNRLRKLSHDNNAPHLLVALAILVNII